MRISNRLCRRSISTLKVVGHAGNQSAGYCPIEIWHVVNRWVVAGLALAVLLFVRVAPYAKAQSTGSDVSSRSSGEPSQPADSLQRDYSAELPRFDPLSPSEALQAFDLLDGFRIELVAAEPLVTDPIAFAFDARGRLFVVEMRDYSEQDTERLGRIALLEDTDHDGRMDRRTTFVENLSWPTAAWPWKDGVLVAEPPRITWYRDRDADGVSDVAEDWFVGFRRNNVQGMVNSFRWGVDGLIHGATSSTGAEVTPRSGARTSARQQVPLLLRRRDFGIDPMNKVLRRESGGGQHGLSFNRWGDKFVTSNSDHLQQVIDLEQWLSEHPSRVPMPRLRRSIAEDGPQAEVFRSSPVEPWRIVRTRLRVSGIVPGPVEGGGTAAGYFTGATGTWVMDRWAGFGEGELDTALVCDVGSNLVHRKRLVDRGLFYSGQRIDERSELLRSSDTWFRPVQLGDGPDGSLYIADMYREVIEHPKSLPPIIKKHLDLTSGRDRGRIWRVLPEQTGAQSNGDMAGFAAKSDWNLASLSGPALVARLVHPIAWQRRMASQLLLERKLDMVTAERLREVMLAAGKTERQAGSDVSVRSEGRIAAAILAAHVLFRHDHLELPEVRAGLGAVRSQRALAHLVRLARVSGYAPEVSQELLRLSQAAKPRLQLELACAAAEIDQQACFSLLSELLPQVSKPLIKAVLATAAGKNSWRLLADETPELSEPLYRDWLELLLPTWVDDIRRNNADEGLRGWLAAELGSTGPRLKSWYSALAGLDSRAEYLDLLSVMPQPQIDAFQRKLSREVNAVFQSHAEAADASSVPQVGWFRLLPPDEQSKLAERSLQPHVAEDLQRPVVEGLSWSNHPQTGDMLITAFPGMTPSLQADTLRALADRTRTLSELATALEEKAIAASQIPADIRQRLLDTNDTKLAARFEQVLTRVSEDRRQVIERYASQLQVAWEADTVRDSRSTVDSEQQGAKVFQAVCAQCHRFGGVGNDVGPPLQQLSEKSPKQLLEIILDPNREVDPKYSSYTVLMSDGRVLSGIIVDESAGQIVLSEAGGKRTTINRSDIERLKATGLSLMPIGLEQQVSPQQMSALIRYLKQQ